MISNRSQRVKELFQLVVASPPSDRRRMLAEVCERDADIAADVEALLSADVESRARFLEGAPRSSTDESLPEHIGRFQIVRRIGEGGMGVVYEATCENPRRSVALKLLKIGSLSPDALRRFEYEAEVLANLTHPGIAQVYEVGSASLATGKAHFFAMELIPGAHPLTEFAKARQLDTRQRLALFADACDAVHHGHQKGIIHRDLKPSNIVVDSSGRARIIDFGVARQAVSGDSGGSRYTSAGQIIGTLPYMSPEQVRGQNSGWDIDVRSDVYSLGVVLYELLCDRLPYDVGSGDVLHAARVICETMPMRPSAAHRILRGDLETIVLKALSKDRNERYQTAGDLARDIRHWLAGEPIQARRDSTFYVLRKTVSRYRLAIGVLLCFAALVAGSTVVAFSLMHRAQKSEVLAQENLRKSLIAQARAIRQTGRLGQRFDALDALAKSAAMAPSLEARNEAIAAMHRPDARPIWTAKVDGQGYFDSNMQRCAVAALDGSITIVSTVDDAVLATIPAPIGGMQELYKATFTGHFLIRIYDPPEGNRHLEVWAVPLDSGSSGKPLTDFKPHLRLKLDDVPLRAMHDISPDGKCLAIGRTDQSIRIYDLESLRELRRIPLEKNPSYLSFDSTGTRLALYHANFADAQILNLETGHMAPAFGSKPISWSVAWHPQGSIIAGASGRNVELWDVASNSTIGQLVDHEDTIVHVVYSPDGNTLLTYSWDGRCVLWDARTRRPLLRTRVPHPIFKSDGRAFGGRLGLLPGNRAQIFEFGQDEAVLRLVGTGDTSLWRHGSGAFHPETGLLMVIEYSPGTISGFLRIYDPMTHNEVFRASHPQITGPLEMSPAGDFFVTAADGKLCCWPIRVESQKVVLGPPGVVTCSIPVQRVQLGSAGNRAIVSAYGQSSFSIVDLKLMKEIQRINCLPTADWPALSADGRWAAMGAWRGSVGQVWNLETGQVVASMPMPDGRVAFSPDNRWLAVANENGISLRDMSTWQVVSSADGMGTPLFTPDGRMLAVGIPPTADRIRLLSVPNLDVIAELEPPESYTPSGYVFSPDSARLAVFTNYAGVVHVWDLRQIREQLSKIRLDWNLPPYPVVDSQNHRIMDFAIRTHD